MIVRRIDKNHDMNFGHGIADMAIDAEAVAQNVKTRLYLLQEEWFLDVEAGVPWLQDIMVKPANLALAESIIKQTILDTQDVSEMVSFDMTLDRNTRKISISATVKTIYGDTANIKVTQ